MARLRSSATPLALPGILAGCADDAASDLQEARRLDPSGGGSP